MKKNDNPPVIHCPQYSQLLQSPCLVHEVSSALRRVGSWRQAWKWRCLKKKWIRLGMSCVPSKHIKQGPALETCSMRRYLYKLLVSRRDLRWKPALFSHPRLNCWIRFRLHDVCHSWNSQLALNPPTYTNNNKLHSSYSATGLLRPPWHGLLCLCAAQNSMWVLQLVPKKPSTCPQSHDRHFPSSIFQWKRP